ncbi:monocarboxylate transporter 1-like [Sinocyclocheilus rhinocerous]|uniref:monocarboxylate transporter 1-like n=1 Tax=Sinocyclocheilus rhinocerous TaxID=307959 RepID=UPI0007B9DEAF|nr:PREDICTED: monocarboxylate transporter 1-like [Sinocyclocheilus rhinocerous]
MKSSCLLTDRARGTKANMPPPATTNLGYTPPDGGWGWAVVFGSFISIGFSYAFPKSLTIYFKEYFSISYSEIAWVSAIMLATLHAGGFGLAFHLQPALTIICLPVHPGSPQPVSL